MKENIHIYLVRHGETYLNKYNRMQGWSDAPLTDEGIKQVARAAKKVADVKFDKAFSSDLSRSIKTATMFQAQNKYPKVPITQYPELREAFFGYFEGANGPETWDQICRPLGYSGIDEYLSNHTFLDARDLMHAADPFHDAEDRNTFTRRIQIGFDKVLSQAESGDNILLVCHGDAIRTIIQMLDPSIDVHLPIKNGSINILEYINDELVVKEYDK